VFFFQAGMAGLKNLGHTCALNANVQILAALPGFVNYLTKARLIRMPDEGTKKNEEPLRKMKIIKALLSAQSTGHRGRARSSSSSLAKTLEDAIDGSIGSQLVNEATEKSVLDSFLEIAFKLNSSKRDDIIDPSVLYYGFLGRQLDESTKAFDMLDAVEVFEFLINSIQSDLPQTSHSISHAQMFTGKRKTTYKCTSCEYNKSNDQEPFLDLMLSVSSTRVPLIKKHDSKNLLEISQFTVEDCLAESLFDGDIDTLCPRCNHFISVNSYIQESPKYLVLNVNRAHFYLGKGRKHDVYIDIKESLDLTPFIVCQDSRRTEYELQGIIIHHGRNTDTGHYTCYTKTRTGDNSTWIHCNDSHIENIYNIQDSLRNLPRSTSQPYLLFYAKLS
jgi:ubiquitin C-terminal hydrolase